MKTTVSRADFDRACEAVWTELQYQDALPRRTADEAADPQGFATLGRVYLRRLEDAWADHPGTEPSLPVLRKLAAIFVRGMVYCGVRVRELPSESGLREAHATTPRAPCSRCGLLRYPSCPTEGCPLREGHHQGGGK